MNSKDQLAAAFVMQGNKLVSIREKIYKLIDQYVQGPLDWRIDIASEHKLAEMTKYLDKCLKGLC